MITQNVFLEKSTPTLLGVFLSKHPSFSNSHAYNLYLKCLFIKPQLCTQWAECQHFSLLTDCEAIPTAPSHSWSHKRLDLKPRVKTGSCHCQESCHGRKKRNQQYLFHLVFVEPPVRLCPGYKPMNRDKSPALWALPGLRGYKFPRK